MQEGGIGGSSGAVSVPPGGTAGARTVFLSYASADASVAIQVCEYLENHGVSCWMAPRDVKPGAQYADAIVRAISDAKALVLVLSANSVGSSHVGREIERAASKHKQIIALKVDAAVLTPALEYFLSESQWIDVAALGMPAALARLAEAVGQGTAIRSRADAVSGGGGVGASGRSASNRPRGTANVGKGVALCATVTVALGVVCALAVHFWPLKHPESQAPAVAAISDKSIAVLPFADMSQKKDQEYFGDGMAEEILDLLAKIPGLTVIGRTSSFQFKGKNEDLRKIGTELNAAYVLEGSVRNSGDQVRITAQLINTKTGAHEWSETYDRPIGDVLKLQDAIAAAVARELQLTVAPGHLGSRSTVKNAEAYDLVLRGRHAADRFDKEGLDDAVRLFQQALDRDPNSIDAVAGLAYAYFILGTYGHLAPSVAYEQSRRAAKKVLELEPNNVLAHWMLGGIYQIYDWNWSASENEFRQISTAAPDSWEALNGKAWVSLTLGRWDEALSQIRAALARDPLNPSNYECLAWIQMNRGHVSEAEIAIRRSLDIRPTYGWGHYILGLLLLQGGKLQAALLEMQQEQLEFAQLAGLAKIYHALGRAADADVALTRMIKDHAADNAFQIATVYAFRGQPDEAMQWLERAYAQKDSDLAFIKSNLSLKSIQKDIRFKAFLKKMNLPE